MPLRLEVPGWRTLELSHLVLDVNGTLSLDGALLPGVTERLALLRTQHTVHLLTADTFGTLDALTAALGVTGTRLRRGEPEAPQKAAFVRSLGAEHVAAIGNGANDVALLREAALGIVVLGPEGTARDALDAATVVCSSIQVALDLLLHPQRLAATLRR